jgi:hypothetical protein
MRRYRSIAVAPFATATTRVFRVLRVFRVSRDVRRPSNAPVIDYARSSFATYSYLSAIYFCPSPFCIHCTHRDLQNENVITCVRPSTADATRIGAPPRTSETLARPDPAVAPTRARAPGAQAAWIAAPSSVTAQASTTVVFTTNVERAPSDRAARLAPAVSATTTNDAMAVIAGRRTGLSNARTAGTRAD